MLGLKLAKAANLSPDTSNVDSSDVLETHGTCVLRELCQPWADRERRLGETATLRQCTQQKHCCELFS